MRKNLLLSVAMVSCATVAMAQSFVPTGFENNNIADKSKMVKAEAVQLKESVVQEMQVMHISAAAPVLKAPGDAVYYMRPEGIFYGASLSFTEEGIFTPFPAFVGAAAEWKFRNVSKTVTGSSWSLSDKTFESQGGSVDANGNGVIPFNFVGGFNTTPILKIGTKTYQFGSAAENRLMFIGYGFNPMSYAQMYNFASETLGVKNTKGWLFGTKTNGKNTTEIAAVYEKPQSTLYIKNITANLQTESGELPMTGDKKLTLTIYKLNEEGKITDEVLAQSTAGSDALTDGKIFTDLDGYTLTFKFEEKNPDSGLVEEIGVTLNTAFAICITGFEQAGVNCGLLAFKNEDNNGKSMFGYEEDGKFGYSYWINEDETPIFDVALILNATMPCLMPAQPEFALLTALDEGGAAYCDYNGEKVEYSLLYTSFPYESDGVQHLQIEAPDWLSVDYGYTGDEGEYTNAIALICTADPIPDPAVGRYGDVKVTTYGGVTTTIKVRQGASSISSETASVVKAINNNGSFELTYPAEMTSVDVMNAAGQVVANYNLVGTSFSMPAATLANGLYILKFNGEKSETVKIMK